MQNNKSNTNKPKAKNSWGGVASWYDSYLENDNDSYQEKVITPNLLRVLNIKKNMRVLDLACGQGFFSRKIKSFDADVVGIDISSELINIAKERSKNIQYFVSPAHKIDFIKNESKDVVVIVLALQNIKECDEVVKEVFRVLVSGGRFIIILNHPAFRIPKRSSWGFDEKTKVQYRRIDTYMSQSTEKILMNPSDKKSESTISYHRSLQDLFKIFNKNGFAITKLEEWISHKKSEKGPRANSEDISRKEIPMFMMLEITKIPKIFEK